MVAKDRTLNAMKLLQGGRSPAMNKGEKNVIG